MDKQKYFNVDWLKYQSLVDSLVKQIKEYKLNDIPIPFSGLMAIKRGGLVLGVSLSHVLQLPFYIYNKDLEFDKTKIWLLCDDIDDTGATLLSAMNNVGIGNSYVAVLFAKKHSRLRADFYGQIVEDDVWVVFPWETEKSTKVEVIDGINQK